MDRVYKIADLYIKIDSLYNSVHWLCKDYWVTEWPRIDISVKTDEQDVKREMVEGTYPALHEEGRKAKAESLAVYRKICEQTLAFDAFLMHGALIEYEGRGYLFTAKSGTGKTTHINLWKKVFGEDKVVVVNGDKPIIRFIDGKVYAYGTPWCGKENYNVNTRTELCAIAFVERAEENSVVTFSDVQALPRILSQIMVTDSYDLAKQLELLDGMLERVPTYLLKCNMDESAAKIAYEALKAK